jgi:hypothetical protein
MLQSCSSPSVELDLQFRNILDSSFRLNPAFELVKREKLTQDQLDHFGALFQNQEYYGLLISTVMPELGVLAVNHNSAALFSKLQKAGNLPGEAQDPTKVAGLVLDGILEIGGDQGFLTGPAAINCLLIEPFEISTACGRICDLSFTALKAAQALPEKDPKTISSWLYSYNCLPMSPKWAAMFAGSANINISLDLHPGSSTRTLLNESFLYHEVHGWRIWQSAEDDLAVNDDQPVYKLYISPHPGVLADTFPIVARCISETNAPSFKLGLDAFGLLRPDKLIVYFAEFEALTDLASSLLLELGACPAQGVPFTASLDESGLLSWGMDPPKNELIPGWRGAESWRVWITEKLSRTILRSKVWGSNKIEPWQFALLRLALDGVQPQSWLPATVIW